MSRSLTFTNSIGTSIAFDLPDFLITSLDGIGPTQFDAASQPSPYEDGEEYIATNFPPDIVTAEITISSTKDLTTIYEVRRTVQSICQSGLGQGTLTLNFQGNLYATECLVQKIIFPSKDGSIPYDRFQIQFYRPYPFWRSISPEEITIGVITRLLTFPVTFPTIFSSRLPIGYQTATITGDIPSPCTIVIPGPTTNPVITNTLTGQFIHLSVTIGLNQFLTIKTDYNNSSCRLTTSGVDSNAIGYMSLDSTFFQLIKGDNVINFSDDLGTAHGNPTISWYQWYMGV